MKKTLVTGAAGLAMLVAACGSNQAPENQADVNEAGAMAEDPNNPFAQAETQMNERMMAAVGTDAGDNWAKKMIEHHQGGIDMARIVLEQNPPADVAKMAQETITKQEKDISDIRKLLKEGAPDQQSAELYRPAMMDMQQKMMAAKGASPSETFMRKMLEHHRGAVSMSDVALQNGVSGALREQVQKTRDDNQKEAEMVEAMLGGQSHEQAMAASGAKSADQAKAEPAPADEAKEQAAPRTSSTPATKTAPKPADKPAAPTQPADPHAGHNMSNTQ